MGVNHAALQLGHYRPRPVRAPVPADPGHRMDRGPDSTAARLPAPRWRSSSAARWRSPGSPGPRRRPCRLFGSRPCSALPAPLPGRRSPRWRRIWCRARSCRAPSRCPRSPGRSARSSARRSAATLRLGALIRPMRSARACSPSRSPPCSRSGRSRAPRWSAARPVAADGRWPPLRAPRPVPARRITLDLFAVLFGGATAMLPVFARDILHAGPKASAICAGRRLVGATLTACFSLRPLKHNVGVKMLAAVAVSAGRRSCSACRAGCRCRSPASRFLGAADMFSVFVRQSLIQLNTPDAMRGRVCAISALFISASNELGEPDSGFLAALIGPVERLSPAGWVRSSSSLLWSGGSRSCGWRRPSPPLSARA